MQKEEAFERAVRAIISGEENLLKELLIQHPFLATARFESTKGQPTLLHFVAANGVEDMYQKTPPNADRIAQVLFDHGADPHKTATFYGGGSGSTALVGLVSSTHPFKAGLQEKLVEIFISNGAPVNGIEDDGMPLATALTFWYPKAAKKLISLGANTDNVVFAAAAGKIEKINIWAVEGKPAGPQNYPDPFGRPLSVGSTLETAFVKACLCDQIDTIDNMLSQGFSLDSKTINGQSGLHEAAYRGSMDTVQYLVNRGALHFRDKQFNSLPIHWARAGGREDIFKYLLDRTPLELADYVQFGMQKKVEEILLTNPEKINEENGWPLREAVSGNQVELVSFLMKMGADPRLENSHGISALQIAKDRNYPQIVDILVKE